MLIAAGSVGAGRIASAQSDPVIFSFATVGDTGRTLRAQIPRR